MDRKDLFRTGFAIFWLVALGLLVPRHREQQQHPREPRRSRSAAEGGPGGIARALACGVRRTVPCPLPSPTQARPASRPSATLVMPAAARSAKARPPIAAAMPSLKAGWQTWRCRPR